MRCYLMRGGHFVGVEDVEATTDAEAIQFAIKIFYDRQTADKREPYDGFELWAGDKIVHRHHIRQFA